MCPRGLYKIFVSFLIQKFCITVTTMEVSGQFSGIPVIHEGETRILPGGTTITVQRTSSDTQPVVYRQQEAFAHKISQQITRHGETIQMPDQQADGKYVLHPGETITLPDGRTVSVAQCVSPVYSQQAVPMETIIQRGETLHLPGIGTVRVASGPSVEIPLRKAIVSSVSSSIDQSHSGKTIIRPGETINLPGGGAISVESSTSTQYSSMKTVIYPVETVDIHPESITNKCLSTVTLCLNSVDLRTDDSVILQEEEGEEAISTFSRSVTYDDIVTSQSTDAIRPGETRHIPGVGTISVSKITNTSAQPSVSHAQAPTMITTMSHKAEEVFPSLSSVDNANNGTISSISEIKKGVGVPLKKDLGAAICQTQQQQQQQPPSSTPSVENVVDQSTNSTNSTTDLYLPEDALESFADKMKHFQSSNNNSNKDKSTVAKTSPATVSSPKPPRVASKPPPKIAPKPPKTSPKPVAVAPNPLPFGDEFELPPPPPDFVFEDFKS